MGSGRVVREGMPEFECWQLVLVLSHVQAAQTAVAVAGLCIAVVFVERIRRERL
jgi:hypothetical protein